MNFLLFRASGKKYSVPHCKTSLFLNTQSISLALWSLCGISNSKQHFNAKSSWDWREIPPLKNNYRLLRIIRVWRTFPSIVYLCPFPQLYEALLLYNYCMDNVFTELVIIQHALHFNCSIYFFAVRWTTNESFFFFFLLLSAPQGNVHKKSLIF